LNTTLAMNGTAVRYSGLGAIPDWLIETAPAPFAETPEESEET